jgi:hypothetical protein
LTGINPTAAPIPPTPVPPAAPAVQPLPPTASGDATAVLDPSTPSTAVVVSWAGVFSDPTSPIVSYEVSATPSGGAQIWQSAGDATELTVAGLTPGTAYAVWVEAANADGEQQPVSAGWITTSG